MAEGIKIRQLDATKNIVDSDVLVLDHITADDLTTAVTKQIRFDDFVTEFTKRDLEFSGNVIFSADVSFDDVGIKLSELSDVEFTDLKVGDALVYDGTLWVNGEGGGGFMRGMPNDAEKSPDAELREELSSMEARVRKMRDNRNSMREQGLGADYAGNIPTSQAIGLQVPTE